jgi:transglutaminase-like putative cysteine protease
MLAYEHGHTHVASTAEEALAQGRGVCQDHAHVFIAAARRLGYPTRDVSGYLLMDEVVDQDASHAWAEAWVEGLGWVGFDISNGISPDEQYVSVATGLDYQDAAPVSGVRFGAGGEVLRVSLQVQQ